MNTNDQTVYFTVTDDDGIDYCYHGDFALALSGAALQAHLDSRESEFLAQIQAKPDFTSTHSYNPVANKSLEEVKAYLKAKMETDQNTYLESKGYGQGPQAQYLAIFNRAEMLLQMDGLTLEKEAELQAAAARLLAMYAWVNTMNQYRYGLEDDIDACENRPQAIAIVADFTQFNATDLLLTMREFRTVN